jgi:glutaredoxin 2
MKYEQLNKGRIHFNKRLIIDRNPLATASGLLIDGKIKFITDFDSDIKIINNYGGIKIAEYLGDSHPISVIGIRNGKMLDQKTVIDTLGGYPNSFILTYFNKNTYRWEIDKRLPYLFHINTILRRNENIFTDIELPEEKSDKVFEINLYRIDIKNNNIVHPNERLYKKEYVKNNIKYILNYSDDTKLDYLDNYIEKIQKYSNIYYLTTYQKYILQTDKLLETRNYIITFNMNDSFDLCFYLVTKDYGAITEISDNLQEEGGVDNINRKIKEFGLPILVDNSLSDPYIYFRYDSDQIAIFDIIKNVYYIKNITFDMLLTDLLQEIINEHQIGMLTDELNWDGPFEMHGLKFKIIL